MSRHNISEVVDVKDRLIIDKKNLKGEDGHRVFSVRIKEKTVRSLDALSKRTNRSRNELINLFLEYAIENCEVKESLKD